MSKLKQQNVLNDEIDMDNFNVKNWPNVNGEPLDLENYRF